MELSGTPFDNETVSSNSWLVTVHYISRISSLHPHHPASGFPSSAWSSSLVPFSDQSGVNDCDDVLRRVWWWWRRRWWRQVSSIWDEEGQVVVGCNGDILVVIEPTPPYLGNGKRGRMNVSPWCIYLRKYLLAAWSETRTVEMLVKISFPPLQTFVPREISQLILRVRHHHYECRN